MYPYKNRAATAHLLQVLSAGLHDLSLRLAEHETINRTALDALIDEAMGTSEQARASLAEGKVRDAPDGQKHTH